GTRGWSRGRGYSSTASHGASSSYTSGSAHYSARTLTWSSPSGVVALVWGRRRCPLLRWWDVGRVGPDVVRGHRSLEIVGHPVGRGRAEGDPPHQGRRVRLAVAQSPLKPAEQVPQSTATHG